MLLCRYWEPRTGHPNDDVIFVQTACEYER
jgi:hypothetical protein